MDHLELRRILLDLGLSQSQLARDIGCSRRAVVYWAAGRRRIPSDLIRRLRLAERRGYWTRPRP